MISIVPSKKSGRQPSDIELNGVIIGKIEPVEYRPGDPEWHASIKLESTTVGVGLIQGHGKTHLEAITNAVKSGRGNAIELARLVEEFALLVKGITPEITEGGAT